MTNTNYNEKIMVVDDEAIVRQIIQTRLSMIGYNVITANDGEEAIKMFFKEQPQLVVLDVMMPKLDGYSVCQQLRRESDVPIIMLTALEDVADRITGLELGADDYIMKPFSPKELEARIRSVFRRSNRNSYVVKQNKDSSIINIGSLIIDKKRKQVFKDNKRLRLTGMEFSLLELLINRSGESVSRYEILKEVWEYGNDSYIDTRVVDVHISRLRSKLEEDPANPDLILTVRGIGYLFQKFD
uniref:Probable transcriptional regulator ycf27 n=1 Tax=Chlorokybus atmophyticus TaxID=3144 RepID=A2CI38_CHLAT|nr:Ycf27 [Chlorokybus atmophyticus]ABM87971.1 regulatory component of sensory transduction system [Chlorokybus atmophyticus]WKT05633.1 Ycf27 [Chlorokybus atmophyticus]